MLIETEAWYYGKTNENLGIRKKKEYHLGIS